MDAYSFLKRWLTTTNHKDIGILYTVTALYFLLVGGSLAILFRIQLMQPLMDFLGPFKFNQAITLHGLIMVLWAVSPLAFGLANYFIPLQIGARDLAFPRLNALSYWLYLFSGLLLISTVFLPGGGPDVGWTVYAPLSTAKYSPQPGVTVAGLAIIMLTASVTLGTINFIVTIAKMRAPGLTWMKLPMFTWGILFTVVLMLFAFPPLAAAVLLLAIDRLFAAPFFSSPYGGAILWGHMFWFFGHPEVYVVLSPAFLLIMDIVSTFTGRELVGKKYVIYSIFAAVVLSFIVYIHHMFTTGINPVVREIYSVTTETISIPFGVATLSIIATLYKGRIRFTTPMLFAVGSVFLFMVGGSTGVYLSSVALDHWFRGTYWVVAHLHYQLVGAAFIGLVAGLYYYYPKITGRMYNEKLGKLHFALAFISFNMLYFPMFLLYDMPRRIYTYDPIPQWTQLNMIATMGGWLFGFSVLIMLYNFIVSLRKGEPVGNNPWDAKSLEWTVPSPPPEHNFDQIPNLGGSTLANGGVHEAHEHVHFETLTPFLLSLGIFLLFVGLVVHISITIFGLLIFLGTVASWIHSDINEKFVAEEVELEAFPYEGIPKEKLGTWVLVASETLLFSAVIGAYLFLRVRTPDWPASYLVHDVRIGFINTVILLTSSLAIALATAYIKRGSRGEALKALAATFLLGLTFIVIKAYEWMELAAEGFVLGENLVASVYYVATGLHAAHVLAGLIVILYVIVKLAKQRYSAEKHIGIESAGIYWHFVDIVWLFLFPLFYLI